MTGLLPVTYAPAPDPGQARQSLQMPAGLTIAQIVAQVVPGLSTDHWGELRVTLVTPNGALPVELHLWKRVRPKAGVHTVIRLRPGGPALAPVLISVLSTGASYFGPVIASSLFPQAGLLSGLIGGLITAGITIAGTLLVNALIPPPTTNVDRGERRSTYAITGWRNQVRAGQPVPLVLGRHRYAPPFAAGSYTEIIGDTQYVRALFTFGYGRVSISDLRLGDTPLDEFDEVETEVREGTGSDAPVTLYPRQVIEDPTGVELVRPFPRDDDGEVLDAEPTIETPVVRFTAADAEQASAIISFGSGLFRIDDEGDIRSQRVNIRIRQRVEGGSVWATVTTMEVRAKKREAFYRQHTWTLPSRGRWEIQITRMTDERTDPQTSDRCHLAALQSIRPEYPLNFGPPLALVAMRIKATHQLTGTLDDFNALVQRYGPVWSGSAWSTGLTRNPASAFLSALQSEANAYPVADGGIDLDVIADWYEFCADKGLKYDRVHDQPETLAEALRIIAAAGRAGPRHSGLKWGVIIDRPEDLIVDHISARNSSGFAWARTYFDPPDGFRIPFPDETNDYERAERIVPWIGHVGSVDLTEVLELPGKTDPDEIYIEARRRMRELIYRPDTYTAVQDGQARVATRGDQVAGSFDLLSRTQVAARAVTVADQLVELDDVVTMEEGTDYGLRVRRFADENDAVGTSVVTQILTVPGTSRSVILSSADGTPAVGDLVHFGPLTTESLTLRIKAVEPGEGMASVLQMVDAAPQIDTETDAETPPAWNGRVGAEVELTGVTPGVPYFTAVEHGLAGTGDEDGLRVLFAPGIGTVPTAIVRVEHKLSAAGSWTEIDVPVGNGATDISGYSADDEVNLRLFGEAADGTESAASATVTIVIGAADPDVPGAIDESSVILTTSLGFAQIAVATGADPAFTRLQVYRKPTGVSLDKATHAIGAPVPVTRNTTLTVIDGDATRANLIVNGDMDSASTWTLDANWTISGGVATHTPGAADAIKQTLSLTAGETYRGRVEVANRTAGSLTPALFGGTNQTDTAISTDGLSYPEITAVSGNTSFGFGASSDFDGDIDEPILFVVTPACVDHGTYDYVLEPQNTLGGAGPLSSAFTGTII